MRKLIVILLFGFCCSCNLYESKEKKTQERINQEMLQIDWNDVDQYPLFEVCDELAPKNIQRQCFENELLTHFRNTLSEFEFTISPECDNTVYVDFVIDQDGKIAVVSIEKDKGINEKMPEFDGIISQSLRNLPPLNAALKRGIPVKAKFRIPIVLNRK